MHYMRTKQKASLKGALRGGALANFCPNYVFARKTILGILVRCFRSLLTRLSKYQTVTIKPENLKDRHFHDPQKGRQFCVFTVHAFE